MTKIKLAKQGLHNLILESTKRVLKEINNASLEDTFVIGEGIDLEYNNGKGYVSFNPTHQNLVNTSYYDNPTVNNDLIDGVPVWSVFRRNHDGETASKRMNDGNPLIYAFKQEGWQFKTPHDKKKIVSQMARIMKKFIDTHSTESTVVVPSTSVLNSLMARTFKDIDRAATILDGLLEKMSVDEVVEELFKPDSEFIKKYTTMGDKAFERICDELEGYLNNMSDGIFRYHYIKNRDLRNTIQKTLKLCDNHAGKYGEFINGKHILIIDDTISRGQIIKNAIELIRGYFTPKSITVLTMFSAI